MYTSAWKTEANVLAYVGAHRRTGVYGEFPHLYIVGVPHPSECGVQLVRRGVQPAFRFMVCKQLFETLGVDLQMQFKSGKLAVANMGPP